MANKKDMNDLLDSIERLCLQFQGMKYILEHYGPDRWRSFLSDYQLQSGFQRQVYNLFDEIRGKLQLDAPDVATALVHILDSLTLPKSL